MKVGGLTVELLAKSHKKSSRKNLTSLLNLKQDGKICNCPHYAVSLLSRFVGAATKEKDES